MLLLISFTSSAQSHHQIEYDKYEQSIINDDNTILKRISILNNSVATETDLEKIRQKKAEMYKLCHQLKENVDAIRQYRSDKFSHFDHLNGDIVNNLKSIGLDLK